MEKRENAEKNEHGSKAIDSLELMIDSLQKRDYIVHYEKKYRLADPNYEEEQFYFQFLIEFHDTEQWILHSTTSIRERVTEQQWNSEHIKRLNAYVKKAYIVVPDRLSEKERQNAENYNNKIIEGRIFSALDGVITQEEAYRRVELKAHSLLDSGRSQALRGLHFEHKVVDALNNTQNLERWKNTSNTAVGYLYSLFSDIMSKLGINKNEVLQVWATSDIPRLPSGGMPKTDVYLEIDTITGKQRYCFSCKRSNAEWVSVHEYTADAFAEVLNPNDGELRSLLIEFQDAGGIRAMNNGSAVRLEQRLSLYREKLSDWVVGGIGGERNSREQWATHVITFSENTSEFHIYTIDEYVKECESSNYSGQFGTPFQWTYPSGGKGKRIQLKGKMI